ncbi:beta-ketoacyl synthase N-terminal-like domain-containing protein [Embleya hyalina]|uniref:3-oxoacyl-[acyl-carrier-protein] synthase 2 n=1 Tax=Embleya hyalina TaxID=516124 RepID=A0A401YM95_9ACTN|nr:beta-ketoacyl synthase N-terminal-like domain-containing protein [Embleya hyalina]GCD95732.1 3-oxoacyl-[acyl-carrier-protein] synthase 2 [Embleya hyalina]
MPGTPAGRWAVPPDGTPPETSPVITGCGLAVSGLRDEYDLLEPTATGAEHDPDAGRAGPGMRHKDRASRLALHAVRRALAGAALPDPAATAVVVSSNFGNLDTVCDFTDTIAAETVTGLSPIRVPHMSSNVTAGWVALEHSLRGPNITLCSGTTSGLDAVFWAATLLAAGRAEAAVVVGVEPDTAPVARLHREHGARSWLDGAACLIVEKPEHARARGVRPRAVITGYGRAARRDDAVRQATKAYDRPLGLWVAPGPGGLDLTARLGRCSGALGVLQCAAAAARFDRSADDAVQAVAGDEHTGARTEGDPGGVAALLLTRPESGHPGGDRHDIRV